MPVNNETKFGSIHLKGTAAPPIDTLNLISMAISAKTSTQRRYANARLHCRRAGKMLHQLREWLTLALQRTGSNTLNDLDSFWTVSILPGMMQRSSSIVTQTPPMHITCSKLHIKLWFMNYMNCMQV